MTNPTTHLDEAHERAIDTARSGADAHPRREGVVVSMSTPAGGGGSRRPSVTKPGGKPVDGPADSAAKTDKAESGTSRPAKAKAAGTKTGSAGGGKAASAGSGKAASGRAGATKAAAGVRPGGQRPAAAGGGKGGGRRPIAPVRVSQGRNWGPIALFAVVGLLAIGIVGFAGWQVYQHGRSWQDRAKAISGLVNYRDKDKSLQQPGQHAWGPLKYPQSPPVGGKHNPNYQDCMGDVYDAPIANEHAVHSMEHGSVWVTYNPDKLGKADVDKLAAKVRGKEFMLMSPYKDLDKPISLQAWGYQLKLDSASDGRIDDFIKAMRKNAGIEDAACSGGITETGTTPHDLGKDQPQQQQQPVPGPTR